ncbi:protein Aster-B isoform X2 [Nematostella vectensis]|uniref:protein Aster-B isoform X2 n=1 Tax=Nematostella vectensis TaxID=45351 RepID=UPI002076D5B4|nr:protein Aster-B isoform X2 [Nematostella vectensis]
MDSVSLNGESGENKISDESKERPKSLDLDALPSTRVNKEAEQKDLDNAISRNRNGSSSMEDVSIKSGNADGDTTSLELLDLEGTDKDSLRSSNRGSRSIADSLKSRIRDLSPSRHSPSPKPDRKAHKNKSPKSPRSPGGWLPASFNQMFSSYKSKSGDFRRLFKDLPDSEQLIVDYSCALQRDILVHGRLYISQNWLCFYANIFGWETFVTINCSEVISIRKEKTALVIPNAIQISTEGEKYFFASFISRDTAFTVLFRIWQNALLDQPLSPNELIHMVGKYSDPRHECSTEEDSENEKDSQLSSCDTDMMDEEEDDDDDDLARLSGSEDPLSAESNSAFKAIKSSDTLVMNPELSVTPPSPTALKTEQDEGVSATGDSSSLDQNTEEDGKKKRGRSPSPGVNKQGETTPSHSHTRILKKRDKRKHGSTERLNVTRSLRKKESSDMDEEGTVSEFPDDEESVRDPQVCMCERHLAIDMVDEEYPVGVDSMYELIFTESDFYKKIQKHRKTKELVFRPWQKAEDGQRRVINYTIALNYSIGPKSSPTTELQHCFKGSIPGKLYVVEAEVTNEGIPYGESFSVLNRYCITKNTDKSCRLRVTSEIRYKKSVWGFVKNMIEKNASDGLKEYFTFLASTLRQETDTGKKLARRRSSPSRRHKRNRSLKNRDEVFATPPSSVTLEDQPLAEVPLWRRSLSRVVSLRFSIPHMKPENKFAIAVVILLALLLCLNTFLMYRLLALERAAKTRYDWAVDIDKMPTDAKDWARMLQQQKSLYDAEMTRWRDILSTSINLMNQAQHSLLELQSDLHNRDTS